MENLFGLTYQAALELKQRGRIDRLRVASQHGARAITPIRSDVAWPGLRL
jgi:hypothetical protein